MLECCNLGNKQGSQFAICSIRRWFGAIDCLVGVGLKDSEGFSVIVCMLFGLQALMFSGYSLFQVKLQ